MAARRKPVLMVSRSLSGTFVHNNTRFLVHQRCELGVVVFAVSVTNNEFDVRTFFKPRNETFARKDNDGRRAS